VPANREWQYAMESALDTSLRPDVTIAVRLEPDNQSVRDYYMFPGTDLFTKRLD